jgi:hypothetical protein
MANLEKVALEFYSPVHTSDFLLRFSPFVVNVWINNECVECVLPHLNIRDW